MVAFAADLFGETDLTLDQAREHSKALADDTTELRARMRAALAVLERHPNVDCSRLAAVGYCFGGGAAVELARDGAPLAALVSFHGGVLPAPPEDDAKIRARVLLCHGADCATRYRDVCAGNGGLPTAWSAVRVSEDEDALSHSRHSTRTSGSGW